MKGWYRQRLTEIESHIETKTRREKERLRQEEREGYSDKDEERLRQ